MVIPCGGIGASLYKHYLSNIYLIRYATSRFRPPSIRLDRNEQKYNFLCMFQQWLTIMAALSGAAITPAVAAPQSAAEGTPTQAFMFETGTTLLAKCRNKAPEYALACTAYIVGAVDGIKKDVFLGRARPNCWPAQMKGEDVRRVVVAYLERYPDQRKAPASVLVSVALNERYSCDK